MTKRRFKIEFYYNAENNEEEYVGTGTGNNIHWAGRIIDRFADLSYMYLPALLSCCSILESLCVCNYTGFSQLSAIHVTCMLQLDQSL